MVLQEQSACGQTGGSGNELSRDTGVMLAPLKSVLQCELQNSRIIRSADHAEGIAVRDLIGTSSPETIRNVESLGTDLHPVGFAEIERPRQGQIK
jgi:hypothetical protein